MLIKVKDLRKVNKKECAAIYNAIRNGHITKYTKDNDVAYDPAEWGRYRKNIHWGRPTKMTNNIKKGE